MVDEQQLQNEIAQYTGGDVVPVPGMDAFSKQLSLYINELIANDFNKLVFILYRLDISEQKLKQLLAEKAGMNAGELIAAMIIERQLQKIQLRKQYRQDDSSISEEDKW